MIVEDRMRIAGIIASISAMVFAIPHFWFWFGISFTFPGDFQTLSKTNALLIVGGFAILAAIYPIMFTHSSWGRRLPEFIIALPAWCGAIGFTLWGLAYFGLQVLLALNNDISSPQYFASTTNPNAFWGIYWYLEFLIWGLSLGMAAFNFHKLMKCQNKDALESISEARNLTKHARACSEEIKSIPTAVIYLIVTIRSLTKNSDSPRKRARKRCLWCFIPFQKRIFEI